MPSPNGILGVGTFFPEEVRGNDRWPASFRERFEEKARGDFTTPEVMLAGARSPEQRILFEQMLDFRHDPFRGSFERRIAPEGMLPSAMEIAAARQACERAGVEPESVDLILGYSAPTDKCLVGNAGLIQRALGAKRAQAVAIDTGCASFLSGLALADAMISSGQARRALVVCSAAFSRLADWDDPQSVNIGDGAAAAVVGPTPDTGFEAHASRTLGEFHSGVEVGLRTGEPWYLGNGRLLLQSTDLEVARSIVLGAADTARVAVEAALRKAGKERSEVSHFYCHQPSAFFVESCRRASGLDHCTTTQTFRSFGSVGAANIPTNLFHAQQSGQLKRGDRIVLYAIGAGLTWAATVLRWTA